MSQQLRVQEGVEGLSPPKMSQRSESKNELRVTFQEGVEGLSSPKMSQRSETKNE